MAWDLDNKGVVGVDRSEYYASVCGAWWMMAATMRARHMVSGSKSTQRKWWE